MKNYFFVSFLILNISLLAQDSPLCLKVNCGINYLYPSEILYTFNDYPERTQKFGYNVGVFLIYFLNENSSIWCGIEYINSKMTARGRQRSSEWVFHGVPISFGYQYFFNKSDSKLKSYISANLSFYLSYLNLIKVDYSEKLDVMKSENGIGVDCGTGILYNLFHNISANSEIKFRYANGSIFTEDSKYASIEFTGIYLLAGISYFF